MPCLLALVLAACESGSPEPFMRVSPTAKPIVSHGPAVTVTELPSTDPAIRYTVSFPEAHTHYVEIEAVYPTGGRDELELMMAVWTPGSYLVREYQQHMDGLTATGADGKLPVTKSRKNRWRIPTQGSAEVTVRYRLYGRVWSVRNNWVEADFAMMNGAPSYVTVADARPRPHEVKFVLPEGWRRSETALPTHPSGEPHHYKAPDFDTLIDSPVLLGNPTVHRFSVEGKPFFLVNEGEAGIFDGVKAAADVEKIARANVQFWKDLPVDRYYFLNVLGGPGGGGLEHKHSTLIMASRWATRDRSSYNSFLRLVNHEFFHTWNVKRLRPIELGPFDYENEVHTKSLWVAEGITSYYDRLLLHRAGITTQAEYLTSVSGMIKAVQGRPGRKVQPLEDASYDAWIKHYRGNENTPNTTVNYYTRGAVVAFLLDARIRGVTEGRASLDDVMRLAYRKYSGTTGFTPEEFREVVAEVANAEVANWLARAVTTTADLDYGVALDVYGLQFKPAIKGRPKGSAPEPREPAYLGAHVANEDGRIVVMQVARDTVAHDAGFNVGDEILALDEFRIRPNAFDKRLKHYQPGQRGIFTIARRDQLMKIPVIFSEKPKDEWKLEVVDKASDTQNAQRKSWLLGQLPGS